MSRRMLIVERRQDRRDQVLWRCSYNMYMVVVLLINQLLARLQLGAFKMSTMDL